MGFSVNGVTYAIRPHKKAPLFSNPNDASLIISQLLGELAPKAPRAEGAMNEARRSRADEAGRRMPQGGQGSRSDPLNAAEEDGEAVRRARAEARSAAANRTANAAESAAEPRDLRRSIDVGARSAPSDERSEEALPAPKAPSSKELLEYIRQAGFVSLFFFLKHIAAASGPYDFLNTGVHLDLANFRQSDYCMKPGASAAIFLPRGFAKSTVCTHGAVAWEALREPNIRMRVVNAVITRAHEFKNTAQRVFDSNPLVSLLYPEVVPTKDSKRWTNSEFVMANADRFYREPTVAAGGASGASEGDHHDVLQLDDLIGMDEVDDNYNANQRMRTVKTWMDINMTALMVSQVYSRRILVATRYGRGDVYQGIWDDCKEVVGYKSGINVKTDPKNTWTIYYRHAVEDGVATNPWIITKEQFEKMLKENPMVAAFQYANNVDISINNEFAQYETKVCRLESVEGMFDWEIKRPGEESVGDPAVLLSECNVCISVDWAGSRKQSSKTTSRTSIGVWAVDYKGRRYRIDQEVGFMAVPDAFKHIFRLYAKYEGFVQAVLVEANAMQLGIVDLFDEACEREEVYLNRVIQNAKGDKVVRIRTVLIMPLAQGNVYLAEGAAGEFTEERLAFPSARLDVLDESAKALAYLEVPLAPHVREERQFAKVVREHGGEGSENAFGY